MSDDSLPAIGIGTYDLDHETCERSVEIALETGYRHVDTAEMYENEAAVGEAIERATVDRSEVVLATKIHSRHLAYDDVLEHARACRDRLGVDVIDLLYVHWPIRAYDPDETLAAFDDLHDRGLVGHVGLSNFTPPLLDEALATLDAPLYAHQVECHPLLPQDALRERAREDGHYLVAYSPLAKGAVTDVPAINAVAAKHDCSPAQVSLAWLCSKEAVVAIPRSATAAHIRENFEARGLDLDPEDVARIDDIDRTERQVDFEGAPWH